MTEPNVRASSGEDGLFTSIPWCAALLADKDFTTIPTLSREPKSSTEDSFFAETLRTNRTIRRCQSMTRLPDLTVDPPIREARTLFALGDGLNGYPHICHGGMVATLLDEVMGVLLTANMVVGNANNEGAVPMLNTMTKTLEVTYNRPVKTPSILLATSRIDRVEGRKKFVVGTIEDETRTVLAQGKALFVSVNGKL